MSESNKSSKNGPVDRIRTEGLEAIKTGFGASGWLMMYQFGVAGAMQDAGMQHTGHFVGSSGGSLVAGCLALDVDIEFVRDFILKCCAHCRASPLPNMFRLREYVMCCIQQATDGAMHRSKAVEEKRLHVSVTLLPSFKNVLLSEFGTNEEVVESLLASCCMSPLAGMPFKLRRGDDLDDTWVFDGGLTFMHPHLGHDDTVSVSAFYFSKAEIRPSQFVPLHWALFPPSVSDMEKLYWLGHHDASVYLESRRERLLRPEKPLAVNTDDVAWRNGVGLGKDIKLSATDDNDSNEEAVEITSNDRVRGRSWSMSSASGGSWETAARSRRSSSGGGCGTPLSDLLRPHVSEEFGLSRCTYEESVASDTSETSDKRTTDSNKNRVRKAAVVKPNTTMPKSDDPPRVSAPTSFSSVAASAAAAAAVAVASSTKPMRELASSLGLKHRNNKTTDGASDEPKADTKRRPVRRAKTTPAGPVPRERSWALRLNMKALAQEINSIELSGRRTRSPSGDNPLDAKSFKRLHSSETWDWPLTETRHRRGSLSIHSAKHYTRKWWDQFLDILFVISWWIFRVVVRPFAYYLMYAELFSRAFFSATRAVVVGLEKGRRTLIGPGRGPVSLRDMLPSQVLGSARAALYEGVDHLKSALNPRLFLSSVPIVGRWFVVDDVVDKVEQQSMIYRVFRHANIYNRSK